MKRNRYFLLFARVCLTLAFLFSWTASVAPVSTAAQGEDNPNPPEQTVKLVFIHHSTGENWLRDDWGGLGRALGENNYFVSDTNYGWGPEAIGDRTDIFNWPEWFRGPNSAQILDAVYNESGQNSAYTRSLGDPGGENEIVMFKSCFPNSMLEGQPGDPPAAGDGLTVGNAKYIYNDLLNYFRTRPDKLFVVITAPPVQDSSYADNARAFNLWLMQDWLNEASYPYNNVVVFDFYNVLTHPDNHHRYANGQIEYEPSHGNNTSRYASAGDDDHPNAAGSRKATEEFIPLLNLFYHRWKAGSANIPPGAGIEPVQNTPVVEAPGPGGPALPNPITGAGELIDDFEAGSPADSDGWQAWWDEATQTRAACAAEGGQANSGTQALHITYAIDAGSWMTCALIYASAHPWDAARGVSLYVHALQPGLAFDVNTYRGPDENRETYVYSMETTQEMVDGWAAVTIPWGEFLRADWEANAGTPFNPAGASGMAFGFGSDIPISGEIWIDDVTLFAEPALIAPAPTAALGSPATQQPAAATEEVQESQPETEPETETEEEDGGGGLPCPSALVMGLVVAGLFWQRRR